MLNQYQKLGYNGGRRLYLVAFLKNRNECNQMSMTGTLQRVIEAGCIVITTIPYELSWGEIYSAEDLSAYQGSDVPGGGN